MTQKTIDIFKFALTEKEQKKQYRSPALMTAIHYKGYVHTTDGRIIYRCKEQYNPEYEGKFIAQNGKAINEDNFRLESLTHIMYEDSRTCLDDCKDNSKDYYNSKDIIEFLKEAYQSLKTRFKGIPLTEHKFQYSVSFPILNTVFYISKEYLEKIVYFLSFHPHCSIIFNKSKEGQFTPSKALIFHCNETGAEFGIMILKIEDLFDKKIKHSKRYINIQIENPKSYQMSYADYEYVITTLNAKKHIAYDKALRDKIDLFLDAIPKK